VNEPTTQRIAGIREDLPPGERVLWQGAPRWQTLAIHAYHCRKVALYFGILLVLQLVIRSADGLAASELVTATAALTAAAAGTVALLMLLAWATSRTTIYAITNRRVFMKIGIAVPVFMNLPFAGIESAALRLNRDDTGDIPLKLKGGVHLAYLHLWPHARPGLIRHPEPMLRAVPDIQAVAQILAQALASAAGMQTQWQPNRNESRTDTGEVLPTSVA
jgi:hypothetical protein